MIELQTEITPVMRAILIDWLIEVAEEYQLTQQTLFLAVSYVDRVLGRTPVPRHYLQLIGVCCLLIASYVFSHSFFNFSVIAISCGSVTALTHVLLFRRKYEEIFPPTVDDFVYIADFTYPRRQVRFVVVFLGAVNVTCKFLTTPSDADLGL